MTVYESRDDLDRRTRKTLQSALMPGERFVFGATASDGLIERWATRIIITTKRILAIRQVGLEKRIRGFKHDRIETIRTDERHPTRLTIERPTGDVEYDFRNARELRRFVDALEEELGGYRFRERGS